MCVCTFEQTTPWFLCCNSQAPYFMTNDPLFFRCRLTPRRSKTLEVLAALLILTLSFFLFFSFSSIWRHLVSPRQLKGVDHLTSTCCLKNIDNPTLTLSIDMILLVPLPLYDEQYNLWLGHLRHTLDLVGYLFLERRQSHLLHSCAVLLSFPPCVMPHVIESTRVVESVMVRLVLVAGASRVIGCSVRTFERGLI
jgi:hypothetical protein